MPANVVTATANYEDIEYAITVNGGTANKEKAIYGETVYTLDAMEGLPGALRAGP